MNPSPSLSGALWSGNQQLATKRQLLSSIAGLYTDLQDLSGFSFQNLFASTVTTSQFVSTPILIVSSIVGATIDISGVTITNDGLLNAPIVSLSSLSFKGFDTLADIDVSFDLGLGNAVGGLAAGLGGLVGGAFIGVGTGVGLTVQAAGQGIATLINGRPQNFISQTDYETINFTTQLQVSTLGNAYPLYSSIVRTVSSVSANQVPGREVFVSSFFQPGQICIRSVSDPFNLITGDSNVNTSTIQSFGQWVPLEGLEPENIVAQSVSTTTLEAQVAAMEVAVVNTALTSNLTAQNLLVTQAADFNYQVPLTFELGALNNAALVGNLNRLYAYTDTGIIFTSDSGFIQENASLMLGSGGESLLTVSSLTVPGFIQATAGFFSSLTVESLTVISTINTTSTNIENITSTTTLNANTAFISSAFIQTLGPFTFDSALGNPTGLFDFGTSNFVLSTTHDSVSSLTHNILRYDLVTDLQDQAQYTLPTSLTTIGTYNVGQWASTILLTGIQSGGELIALPSNSCGPGTFDLTVGFVQAGLTGSFTVAQYNTGGIPIPVVTYPLSTTTSVVRQRFTFDSSGVLIAGGFNPVPYETVNSNTFTITQDMNDVFITTSDRLVLTGGDVLVNGLLNASNTSFTTMNARTGNISTLNTNTLLVSSIVVNSRNPVGTTGGVDMNFFKPSTVSFNAAPQVVTPQTMNFTTQTADFLNIYNLIPPFQGSNAFNSYNVSSWNMSVFNQTTAFSLGTPGVFLGDVQTPVGTYAGQFYINNTIVNTPINNVPIFTITSAGATQIGFAAGGQYALISTSNGVTWTITSNVDNPQGNAGGIGATYSNIVNIQQFTTGTTETHTQNYLLQAPTTQIVTSQFNLFADAIRVNSRRQGANETAGLPSYPIGMEIGVYQDENIAWTNVGAFWQSDATNVLLNVTGDIFFDINAWSMLVIPSRFRTNNSEIVSYDVQAVAISVGGGGFCWGFSRYIQVNADIGGPGNGATNYNTYMAIPLNYITR